MIRFYETGHLDRVQNFTPEEKNNIEVRETIKQSLLDEMTNLYLFVLIDFQYFIFWFVTLSQIIYAYFTI